MVNELFCFCDSNTVPKFTNVCKTFGLAASFVCFATTPSPVNLTYNDIATEAQIIEYSAINPKIYEGEDILSMVIDARKYENKALIRNLSGLEYDWNGYGGLAFSEESIQFFDNLIDALVVQPIISPTGRESLYLEYNDGNGVLGFEAFEDKVDMAYISGEGEIEKETIEKNYCDEINKIVEAYYEQSVH